MADFLNKLKDILSSGGNDDYEVPELMYGFTVTHHAGALHQKPNTLESVSYSVFHGAGCIELDVSFRPDGTRLLSTRKSRQAVRANPLKWRSKS